MFCIKFVIEPTIRLLFWLQKLLFLSTILYLRGYWRNCFWVSVLLGTLLLQLAESLQCICSETFSGKCIKNEMRCNTFIIEKLISKWDSESFSNKILWILSLIFKAYVCSFFFSIYMNMICILSYNFLIPHFSSKSIFT